MLNEMNKVYLKLKQNRNPLDIRKTFLSREVKPWHSKHEGWRVQHAAIWFGIVNTTMSLSQSLPALFSLILNGFHIVLEKMGQRKSTPCSDS